MPTNVTLTNQVANSGKGWFPATRGNCSWQLSSITPGDGAASSIKIIPSGAGEVTLTSASHAMVASHKYYVTFKIRFEAAVTGTCDWYWPVAEPCAAQNMAFNAAAGAWTRLSAVFDRTSFADGSYPCRFDYNNNDGGNVLVHKLYADRLDSRLWCWFGAEQGLDGQARDGICGFAESSVHRNPWRVVCRHRKRNPYQERSVR